MREEKPAPNRPKPSEKLPEREAAKVPCCPALRDHNARDVLDFHYRLVYPTRVPQGKDSVVVNVEVILHARLQRWTAGLGLGDLVYSTTLLPGEKVRLFTQDRRSRFTWDSESSLSYRHEQTAEERYYMSAMSQSMSDLTVRDEGRSTYHGSSSFESQGDTSSALGTLLFGASVEVEGSFNSSSVAEFSRELHQHAVASHHQSASAVRTASSVSVGEVQQRSHIESESESHYESASRTFSNPNRCRAVTYFMYQINKIQRMRFEIVAVQRRVIDPAVETKVTVRPAVQDGHVMVRPELIRATSDRRLQVEENARESVRLKLQNGATAVLGSLQNLKLARIQLAGGQSQATLTEDMRKQAVAQVDEELRAAGVLGKGEADPGRIFASLVLDTETELPTPGLLVRGCLDECHVCEPQLTRQIELELEHQELENQKLQREVELLDQAQEYRCCPANYEEDENGE